jgi:putative proteasome-type protease
MTYCVGLFLKDGLVMLADTRTNAGVDNISTFGKLHVFERPGERFIAAMSAGNLAITQSVINQIEQGVENDKTGEVETIYSVPTMFRAAQLVGETIRKVYKSDGEALEAQGIRFDISILLGGQLKGRTQGTSSRPPKTRRSCKSASINMASPSSTAPPSMTLLSPMA